jgi:hypothetical protein
MDVFGATIEYWKKEVKPLRDLVKYTGEEVASWVKVALDETYPRSRKIAFARITGMSWDKIRSEIIQTVAAQNYSGIHRMNNLLSLDLLDFKIAKKIGAVIDGTLAVIKDKDSPSRSAMKLAILAMLNEELKNAKLETYLLYRRLAGKPRLSFGFLNRV